MKTTGLGGYTGLRIAACLPAVGMKGERKNGHYFRG